MEWWQKSFCFFNARNASSNSGSSPGKWALEIAFLVQREIKRCAFSNFTFGPRIATVPSYNSRHRCESDTVAGETQSEGEHSMDRNVCKAAFTNRTPAGN